ncbi:hypothetical protein D9757_003814 [Collybiopsis confluens]|uniref:RNA-dependent RNA polymerase n=1 Tax=Collybiopsis confluens TaxID=2823264 RepID=A0A8H5MDU2_9AGAR|nr:hypothetical protein D9757_003814 [Collybiopsis confluens]
MDSQKRKRADEQVVSRVSKARKLAQDQPVVVAHDPKFFSLMCRKKIPYGIQFEIARAVEDNNEALERYRNIISKFSNDPQTHVELYSTLYKCERTNLSEREVASSAPWKELDLEDKILRENPLGGIGNNPAYPSWWAGKIDFRAKLEETGDCIVLDKTTLGPSNKIKRRFGSHSIIRVKVNSKRFYAKNSDLVDYFKRPFIIWNYVFRAFFAKDNTVFLFRTNEAFRSGSLVTPVNDSAQLSLLKFIKWMIPFEDNGTQKICKWAARMALGLSSSVPGPRLSEDELEIIDDIYNDEGERANMTDGCGTSSLSLHKDILDMFGLISARDPNCVPVPICRCQVDEMEDGPRFSKIRLRPSQIKILYPQDDTDPSHLTIDLLRFARTKTPAKLSEETIKNLHHNGVPASVFIALLERQLRTIVDALTAWEGPDAMARLWKAVESAENVISARKARELTTDSRARGHGDQDEDEEEDDEIDHDTNSKAWWRDPVSGCPSSLAETVMELLDSGFTPLNSPYLRAKLEKVIRSKVKIATGKLSYVVPMSATAFVVPDPYGVLGADQIHFKSSRREFLNDDGTKTDIILGGVLMTRNPCKVPTDVRKLVAVQHLALSRMVDVIVCTVKGYRRLMDFLAGGDYDGDRGMVIWDADFVQAFVNADEVFSLPPPELEDCFQVNEQTLVQFLDKRSTEVTLESGMQDYLLGSLRNPSLVGEYSRLHENAIYKNGYSDSKTINLAYKFCTILDSAKSGHRLRNQTHLADRKEFSHPEGPAYKFKLDPDKRMHGSNDLPLQRNADLDPFIIDILCEASIQMRNDWMKEIDNRLNLLPSKRELDKDLSSPWSTVYDKALKLSLKSPYRAQILGDLDLISGHVKDMYVQRTRTFGSASQFSSRHIVHRQDTIRDLSRNFAAAPNMSELTTIMDSATIARLKASFAYLYASTDANHSRTSSPFPFDCAFGELCAIKAQASGPHKVCTLPMYELKKQ